VFGTITSRRDRKGRYCNVDWDHHSSDRAAGGFSGIGGDPFYGTRYYGGGGLGLAIVILLIVLLLGKL
jgi:Protein of unknown function (DUF3309)